MSGNYTASSSIQRVLMICAETNSELEKDLRNNGCKVEVAFDGVRAIEELRHRPFDAAVVVSTGNAMDMVETTLNLRELRPVMPIYIVSDGADGAPMGAPNVSLGPTVKLMKSAELALALAPHKLAGATHNS